MKIRIKKKPLQQQEEKEQCIGCMPDTKRLSAFLDLYKKAESYPGKHRVLNEYYNKLWDTRIPDKPFELIKTKIAYELYRQDYKEAGIKLPQSVAQNLKASRIFNIDGFTKNTRELLTLSVKRNEKQEALMPKKKASKEKVSTKKVGVAHLYLEVFDAQASKQLTDTQIADFIEKQSGSRPSEKNVASYRCMYNKGEIKGQGAVPKERVKAFREFNTKKPVAEKKKKVVIKKKAAKKKAVMKKAKKKKK